MCRAVCVTHVLFCANPPPFLPPYPCPCLQEKRQALKALNLEKEHKFWDTQPVKKLGEHVEAAVNEPLDPNTDIDKVRKEPYKMPPGCVVVRIAVHESLYSQRGGSTWQWSSSYVL